MADQSSGRIILMSIHPEYAEALLDGTKTVELRKSPVAGDISHIVIYATAPVQRVLGWVETVQSSTAALARSGRGTSRAPAFESGHSAPTTGDIPVR